MDDKDSKLLVKIHTIVERLDITINGNGRAGLKERVDKWDGAIRVMVWVASVLSIGLITVAVRAFTQ